MGRKTTSSKNKNRSKTLNRVIPEEDLKEIMKSYAFYIHREANTLLELNDKAPWAIQLLLESAHNLEEWSECKNPLTDYQKLPEDCASRYTFMGILTEDVIRDLIFKYNQEQFKELTKDLIILTNRKTLNILYKIYADIEPTIFQKFDVLYKHTFMSKEDSDKEAFDTLRKVIRSFVLKYLEYSKSPYSENPLLSKNQNKLKTLDEIISEENLKKIAEPYAYYLSSQGDVVSKIAENTPYDLPLLLKPLGELIDELKEWSSCKNPLTDDKNSLEYCAHKYSFMGAILEGIAENISEQGHLFSGDIEILKNALTTLKNTLIIKKLYNLYREADKVAEELKLTGPDSARETLKGIISNYLEYFGKYISQHLENVILEYAKKEKFDDIINISACRLYGRCNNNKEQNK